MYVSIDMGGTNTRVASSKDLKEIFKVEKFPTNLNPLYQKELIKNATTIVTEGSKISAVCLGVPGVIDNEKQSFIKLPNYSVLNNVSYASFLGDIFKKIPLVVENDAVLSALGEAYLGSGRDYDSVAYITLSTGVGGSLINKLSKDNLFYLKSEPGHMIIIPNGKLNNSCNQKGCFESYCSGKNFKRNFGIEPWECNNIETWDEYALYLSLGLKNIVNLWNPQVIVLGGSMTKKYSMFIDPLKKYLKVDEFIKTPKILKSEFGDNSGLVGGLTHMKLYL